MAALREMVNAVLDIEMGKCWNTDTYGKTKDSNMHGMYHLQNKLAD